MRPGPLRYPSWPTGRAALGLTGSLPCSTNAGTRPAAVWRRAARQGRGRIYLVWPVFFRDGTYSYRLLPAVPGRLRTDLGGLYVNAIFMLALAGLYAATSDEILLLVIALTHLEMLEQLLRSCWTCSPGRPRRRSVLPGGAETRGSPADGAAPGSW